MLHSSVCRQIDRRMPSVCRVLLAPRVPTVGVHRARTLRVRRVLRFATQCLSRATDAFDAPHPQRPSRDRRGPVRMFSPEFVRRVRRKADKRGIERLSLMLVCARIVPQRQTLEQCARPRLLPSRQRVCCSRLVRLLRVSRRHFVVFSFRLIALVTYELLSKCVSLKHMF
jgi:hypothetical protein